jgi:hypothetical protein
LSGSRIPEVLKTAALKGKPLAEVRTYYRRESNPPEIRVRIFLTNHHAAEVVATKIRSLVERSLEQMFSELTKND